MVEVGIRLLGLPPSCSLLSEGVKEVVCHIEVSFDACVRDRWSVCLE